MSKFATMAGLITDFDRNPSDRHRRVQALDKPRSPSGSRFYANLSRSRTVTISSICNRSAPRSKPPARPIADTVRRRNPNPKPEKSEIAGSSATKRSKLRSIFSVVFPVNRRRRSPSISSQSAADSSSSGMRKGDSNSSLSLSSSSSSSRSSIGGKIDGRKRRKRQNGYGCGGSSGVIVNLANSKGERISRGNSLRRNGIQVVRRKEEEEEEEETLELCKKKILMGMRCRPLNTSGKLRYDEEGVLIPEPLPP